MCSHVAQKSPNSQYLNWSLISKLSQFNGKLQALGRFTWAFVTSFGDRLTVRRNQVEETLSIWLTTCLDAHATRHVWLKTGKVACTMLWVSFCSLQVRFKRVFQKVLLQKGIAIADYMLTLGHCRDTGENLENLKGGRKTSWELATSQPDENRWFPWKILST